MSEGGDFLGQGSGLDHRRVLRLPVGAFPQGLLDLGLDVEVTHGLFEESAVTLAPLGSHVVCGGPLVQGLQPQAEALIVDTQIPVRAARNRIGLHSRNFLRHHPDVGRSSRGSGNDRD